MESDSGSSTPRKVLVVEDDADTREAIAEVLSSRGHHVTTAVHGADALEQLRHGNHPDVILLDLRMPVMDGWEFRLKQRQDPTLAPTPVIAVSADDTHQAEAIDAARFLSKPLQSSTLLQAIDSVVSKEDDRRARENRLAQAQSDRLAALGTLAAGAAHEINNPLAYVVANLGFVGQELQKIAAEIADRSDSSDLVERLQEVGQAIIECREGAERIRTVVHGLKVFSRAEEERVTRVNVVDVLESSLKMVANELRHRAQLVKDFQPVPPIEANEARLGQVFVNLLVNAAQAIPEGNADRHEIRVSTLADREGRAVIRVSDSGVGIEPANLSKIFDPFFTTKPVGIGTGLGLSVCHGIVSSLGGELSVESTPGNGTTFQVRLPAASPIAAASEPKSPQPPITARRARVLVIDDEPIIGAAIRRTLAPDHEVVTCTEAGTALERLKAGERFDVILCDLMMPQVTGMEAYQQIQSIDPALVERVVFLTGGAFTSRAQQFLEAVPNRRVDKPFQPDALRELVRGMIP